MSVPPDKMILKVEEAAEILDISTKTAYEWIHMEGFPLVKIGNCCRIHREQLMEWFKSQAGNGQAPGALSSGIIK